MMDYSSSGQWTCVYDAFHAAGINYENAVLEKINAEDMVNILKKNGYKVYLCGDKVPHTPENQPFFIGLITGKMEDKKLIGHLEYHIKLDNVVSNYNPNNVFLVATKK